MARCAYCGRVCERECPNVACKAPDYKIARKYAKHDGKEPVSTHKPKGPQLEGRHVWPKFDKDAKDPNDRRTPE